MIRWPRRSKIAIFSSGAFLLLWTICEGEWWPWSRAVVNTAHATCDSKMVKMAACSELVMASHHRLRRTCVYMCHDWSICWHRGPLVGPATTQGWQSGPTVGPAATESQEFGPTVGPAATESQEFGPTVGPAATESQEFGPTVGPATTERQEFGPTVGPAATEPRVWASSRASCYREPTIGAAASPRVPSVLVNLCGALVIYSLVSSQMVYLLQSHAWPFQIGLRLF